MKNICIIGSSGHAKVIIDCINLQGDYNIVGLIDDYKAPGYIVSDCEVIGNTNDIERVLENVRVDEWFIAVGANNDRYNIVEKLSMYGFKYATIIHPSTVISEDVKIQSGTVVMAGVVINSGTYIGEHSVINTGAIIEHDNIISDFVSICPRVVTGGNVHISKCAFIGIGSTVMHGISIGEHCVIGAGSVCVNYISGYKKAYGVPCKEISNRKKDDKYL